MIEHIAEELQKQATDTVESYLKRGIEHINPSIDSEFKIRQPEVVAGYITACAIEFQTRMLAAVQQDAVKALCDAIRGIELPQEVDLG